MMRLRITLLSLLVLAACGGEGADSDAGSTTATTPAASSTTTSTVEPARSTTTRAPKEPVSRPAASSTTVAATTTTTAAPSAVLADGRPATFVAITSDYEAVEVDTLTGEILHSYGQTGTPADLEAAEEMPPNLLVGVWRTRDGSMVGLSDCCEPAAGRLFYVGVDGDLGDDPYSDAGPWNTGWTMSPSPVDNRFAVLGYEVQVFDPEGPSADGLAVWIDEPELGFPGGAAAWTRDGAGLYWSTQIKEVAALATLDLAEGTPTHAGLLPWVGVHQSLEGIGSQANGNLVGFLHTWDLSNTLEATNGVVFTTAGELVADFTVETGSTWGGYDASGRFLIYVDGEGTVRWQGLGEAGSIAAGFIFASW